jgi:hypothetical protein
MKNPLNPIKNLLNYQRVFSVPTSSTNPGMGSSHQRSETRTSSITVVINVAKSLTLDTVSPDI